MTPSKPGRSLTLTDIAKLAGVSRSAASRALDRRSPVNGPGAERVRAIAEAHGYVPNARAANLRRGRTGMIGVVVPRLTDTVMAMLYEAIVEECAQSGIQASVVTTGDDPGKELARGRALLQQGVDGFIVTTARTDRIDPFVAELRDKGVPYVFALRTDGTGPAVVVDDHAGGYAATQHLLEAGHREIAFVGGAPYASSTQRREAGFRAAMSEASVPVLPERVHHSNFSIDAGVEIGVRLLALRSVPTAIFAANDTLALGLMSAAQRAGVAVPSAMSVVGYTDTPMAARLAIPLTSVRVPFDQVAREALAALETPSGDVQEVVVPPTFVVRESVVPPSTID